jgi:polyhydroxyalkanoate synthase subunit PhaC
MTDEVLETPLIIFPPWINRFLHPRSHPEEELHRWAVGTGAHRLHGQLEIGRREPWPTSGWTIMCSRRIEAIDACARRSLASRPSTPSAIASPAPRSRRRWPMLAARGEAAKVASATFFTAQVDFSEAGDLKLFLGDEQMRADPPADSAEKGYLDGRYMAATFNLLRGRDLIWNYVVNNYLLGRGAGAVRPAPLELRHHQPAGAWHRAYLEQLYRENLLVQPGAIASTGRPDRPCAGSGPRPTSRRAARTISRRRRASGRSPTISPGRCASCLPAPAISPAWSTRPRPTNINIGPTTATVDTLEQFIAGATEHKGSWWPDWMAGSERHLGRMVPAKGARIPGKGKLKAIEDAPGRYVRTR